MKPIQRRESLGLLALLLQAPHTLAAGSLINIVAVRVWPAAEYTRVTLESDKRLAAKHFLVETPDRLVIDVEGLELNPNLRELLGKVRADDPFIAGVRVGQNTPTVVRIVLDLKQPVAPQIFSLAPVSTYQHRLVFDLYPKVENDPVAALVRAREKSLPAAAPAAAQAAASSASQPGTPADQAAQAMNDALGDLIGKIERQQAPAPSPARPAPAASA